MSDARNIALSREASHAADQLAERFGLTQKVDIVRLGLAYAIRHEVTLDRGEAWGQPGGTNYNVATVDDSNGTFRELVTIFYDDSDVVARPYFAMETLMSKGLRLLKRHVDEGEITTLVDLGEADPVTP